jgi:hypothetical protein
VSFICVGITGSLADKTDYEQKKEKKDNLMRLSFHYPELEADIIRFVGGPYRARTGDLHNAIVALSQTELTARSSQNIPKEVSNVNEKFLAALHAFR